MNPGYVNFLGKKDVRFKSLHGVMDANFHQCHSTGTGRNVKHARVLTTDDEKILWGSGVMGTKTSKTLQNAAFFIERCFAFVVVLNLESSNCHRLRGIQTLTDTFSVQELQWNFQATQHCKQSSTIFSGFSAGCYIERKVICYQLEFGKGGGSIQG